MSDETKNELTPEAAAKKIAELEETNSALVKQLADNSKKPKAQLPQVKVKGETFEFTLPKFNLNGTKYTAQEASENSDVCAELVKIKSAILKKVE